MLNITRKQIFLKSRDCSLFSFMELEIRDFKESF